MTYKSVTLHIIFFFLIVTGLFAGEITPNQVLQNVEKTLNSDKIFNIQFKQTYYWKLTGETHSIQGTLLLDKDRFRMTTEDQVIVSNGQTLWTYNAPANRVLVDQLANTNELLLPRRILSHYSKGYQTYIKGEETLGNKTCIHLELIAEKDSQFPKVDIWVEPETWMLQKIIQEDLNQNQTVFEALRLEVETSADPKGFEFKTPQGAEVIHMN